MGNSNITIKYLYHSGFSVETAQQLLIFDYYQGPVPVGSKETFVFASHSHPDHYNPLICDWQKERPSIHYIFSSDIHPQRPVNNLHLLSPYEEFKGHGITVKAYNSTDIGVSFLVDCAGIRLFHAGDLNWWYWIDTPKEMAKAEKGFKDEIRKLKGEPVDIAFFPVDPRLEANYSAGAAYYIQEIQPQFLIPMHFWENTQAVTKFARQMESSPTQVLPLLAKGQEISLSLTSEK